MKSTSILVATLVISAFLAPGQQPASDWPCWRGPKADGVADRRDRRVGPSGQNRDPEGAGQGRATPGRDFRPLAADVNSEAAEDTAEVGGKSHDTSRQGADRAAPRLR